LENKSKVHDIRKKSDYLNDVLERTPTWIFRWGNTLFLFFIILLIVLSYYIKYPDTISAKVEILTEKPPIEVISKTEGVIDTIFYKDKSLVSTSDTLALIESIISIKDLQELKDLFNQFNRIDYFSDYLEFNLPRELELGELSETYSLLIKDIEAFKYYLRQKNVFVRIKSLEKEIRYLKNLNLSIKKQEELFKEDLFLTEKSYNRQKQLNDSGVVSDDEKEKSESIVLKEKRQLENFITTQINNKVKIEQLKTQINNLISDRMEGRTSKVLVIKQHINKLEGQIRNWEEKHIVLSPISGLLSFTNIWSKDQYISKGQPIFTVVPKQTSGIIGRCQMPLTNSGKVKTGTNVQIRLDAYPYQEFGVLESTIDEISLVPIRNEQNQSFYEIKLKFKDTLVTTYSERIPFRQKMSGAAIIIKEEKSVLDRIFDQFLNIIKN